MPIALKHNFLFNTFVLCSDLIPGYIITFFNFCFDVNLKFWNFKYTEYNIISWLIVLSTPMNFMLLTTTTSDTKTGTKILYAAHEGSWRVNIYSKLTIKMYKIWEIRSINLRYSSQYIETFRKNGTHKLNTLPPLKTKIVKNV